MMPARVAYVVNTFPKFSETFIAGELAELRARRVDVRILSLKPAPDGPQHAIVRSAGLLDRTTYVASAFRRSLDRFKPTLIHAHFATEPTRTARELADDIGVPFTFTAHGYDVYRRPPADFADRAAAAAAVVTVSDANRSHIATTFGVPASRIHVVPCGIDTTWFTPRRTALVGPPLIVCVARLNPVKQLDMLIRACALLRDRGVAFECVIVGEGPDRKDLESLRAELRLDRLITLPGAMEQAQVRRWWRRASVAVLSSRSEGMPVCLMEAAACGVPAVAPAVGGIGELIADGVTGIVTPPNDAIELANGIERVLTHGRMRASMRLAARKRAVARFSRRRQIDDLSAIWSRVVS
jgi:colanic acid/amylovoran biosynthesis glycosyltransferase